MAEKQLVEILSKITLSEVASSVELDGVEARNRIGLETQKKTAIRELPVLQSTYKTAVVKTLAKVFLLGDKEKVNSFLEETKKDGAITFDGAELYTSLATPIEKHVSAKRRVFSANHAVRLIEELTEYCRDNGIKELPFPKFDMNDYGVVPTYDDLVALIKKGVRRSTGDELLTFHVNKGILNKLLAAKISDLLVPVVIYGLADDEVVSLSTTLFPGRPNVVIDLKDIENDEQFVTNVLQKIIENLNAITINEATNTLTEEN